MSESVERPSASQAVVMTKAELADFARAVVAEYLSITAQADPSVQGATIITTGALSINLAAYEAFVGDVRIFLKTREFALLAVLAKNMGRVFSRDHLIELVWPEPDRLLDNRTVDVHIRRLRMALGPAASLIETVHGVGYKLVRVEATSPSRA